jgi:(4-O-methyl)-D-glucuronate---lignin esterase
MRAGTILAVLFLNAWMVFGSTAQVMPLVYDVENTGADCPPPPLPSFDQLPAIQFLPDPFLWADTSKGRLTNRADWRCRRAEIGAEVQHYEQGTKPPPPDTLEASFSADSVLSVTVAVGGKTLTLTSKITLPAGTGPFPAVIGVGFPTGSLPPDIFTGRGIATIQFNESQITPAWSNLRGDGPFFDLYPEKSRGKFIAWAWGVSRLIDGLEQCPETHIDLKHLAVTGCSYAGKIALFSGAFDERIALTISIESGGGGYTAWRVTETLSGSRETLRNAQGQQWWQESVSQFNNAVTKLPYDHHELMAMVAPRALFVTGNPDYEWLADESGHVASMAAHEVWNALGVPDRFGFSILNGHTHCVLPDGQRPEVQNFVDKFLLGDTTKTTRIATTPYYATNLAPWIVWATPNLAALATSVDPSQQPTGRFNLQQNYPNPFNPSTVVSFQLPAASLVSLKIFDLLGREVAVLAQGAMGAGYHKAEWDGHEAPTGVYVCRLEVSSLQGDETSFVQSRKMMLLR